MDNLIKNAEAYELTDDDIHRITRGKCNIMEYEELDKYNSIDEVLGEYGAVVLLYETTYNVGHWVTVFKINNETLEFFDPYGLYADEELLIDGTYNMKMHNGVLTPSLSRLLLSSNYELTYNKYQFQKLFKDVNTCGRHVAVRLRMRNYDLKRYTTMLNTNKYSPDWIVSCLTLFA